MNCVKNGHKYNVWGTSQVSITWFEQNCIIDKVYNEDDKAQLSEESSDDEDKDPSVVHVPLPDIHFESTDKKAFDALVDAI